MMLDMARPSIVKLRRAHLDGDADVRAVEGQRRYRIECVPDVDPIAIWASTQSTTTGRVVLVGGQFVQEAGPFGVSALYDLSADIVPNVAWLYCATCSWRGAVRSWRFRRLMIGDASRHTCLEPT